RMNTDERSRTFSVQIKIADMKIAACLFEPFVALRINRARQAKFSSVRDRQRVIVIASLYYSENRCKNFFLFDRRTGRDIAYDRRFDTVTFFVVSCAPGKNLAAFVNG